MTHPVVLIRNIWEKYRGNFKAVIIASLPLAAAISVVGAVGIFFPLASAEAALPIPRAATIAIYSVVYAAYIVFSFASAITLFLNANRVFNGEKTALKAPYKQSISLFLSVLLVSVLRSLIVLGGLILLVVPGIIWGLRYVFSEQAVIFEGLRGRAALRRSREITSGKLFALFVDLIAIGIIYAGGVVIVSWAVTVVISVLGLLAYAVSSSSAVLSAATYANYAVILVVRWFALIIPFLALNALYRGYKEIKA